MTLLTLAMAASSDGARGGTPSWSLASGASSLARYVADSGDALLRPLLPDRALYGDVGRRRDPRRAVLERGDRLDRPQVDPLDLLDLRRPHRGLGSRARDARRGLHVEPPERPGHRRAGGDAARVVAFRRQEGAHLR